MFLKSFIVYTVDNITKCLARIIDTVTYNYNTRHNSSIDVELLTRWLIIIILDIIVVLMQNFCGCYKVCKYLILITKQAMVYDCLKSKRIKQVYAVLWKRNNSTQ